MTTVDSDDNRLGRSPVVEPTKPRLLSVLGPGLVTGASDDDPSGIATYSQVGAQFAYGASWTLLFSYPLMVAIQIISGRLGRTTGRGVAGNLRKFYSNWLVLPCVGLLLIANVINIGADIGAMGDASKLVIGGPSLLYIAVFGFACAGFQIFLEYKQYVRFLKWLSLALLAYVATPFVVKIDWAALGAGFFKKTGVPTVAENKVYLEFDQTGSQAIAPEIDSGRRPRSHAAVRRHTIARAVRTAAIGNVGSFRYSFRLYPTSPSSMPAHPPPCAAART